MKPLIIAHRGNSSEAPENTLASFRSALQLQPPPDLIELDIYSSSDGVLVVSHDANTLRTTGINCDIRKHTFAELQKLNAGYANVFGTKFIILRMIVIPGMDGTVLRN